MNKIDINTLFSNNEKLIWFVIKKYFPLIYNNVDERNDYYQIGAIGLFNACKNYNSEISKFSTYAIPMIWGEIKRYTRDNKNAVHFSRSIVDMATTLNREYIESKSDIDYETFLNNKLRDMDLSYEEKIAIHNYNLGEISLNTPYSQSHKDERLTLGDVIASNESLSDTVEYNTYIRNICNKLSDRDKKIFIKRLLGHTQETIAAEVNMSQAHVARIFKKCKLYAIKEIDDAGYHDTARKLLLQLFSTDDINNDLVVKSMRQYGITLKDRPSLPNKKKRNDKHNQIYVMKNNINKSKLSNSTECIPIANKIKTITLENVFNKSHFELITEIINLINRFKTDNLSLRF